MSRKTFIPALMAAAMLALPAASSAAPTAHASKIVELGATIPKAAVSCPANCQALSRVTGYQLRAGAIKNPFVVPRAGKIIAFTVRLGQPTAEQTRFFEDELNFGQPKVQLSILRKGKRKKTKNDHRLLAQTPTFDITDLMGTAPTFVLDKPLSVRKNYIVALTTPTWVPALALGLDKKFSWNASRLKTRCDSVSRSAQQTKLMSVKVFGCSYSTVRMYYTATYVPDNRPKIVPKTKTTK
jgi:hypothetical protein